MCLKEKKKKRCSTVTLRVLCKCYVEETLECLRSREGKCETAVWDGIGDTTECVFFTSTTPLYCMQCTVNDMSVSLVEIWYFLFAMVQLPTLLPNICKERQV